MQQPLPFSSVSHVTGMVHLRILETTDLHVHLEPYDYYADRPAPDLGLVRLAELVDQARAEAPNTLLFDNGDFLQGTPVGDFIAYDRGLREGDLHPVIAAMNALGFDAITLGNHEFNYGLEFLMKAIAGCNCPVVAANLLRKAGATPRGDRSLTRPYVLLDRIVHDAGGAPLPLRIGVIGLAPPQVVNWERHHLHGQVFARDMVEAARGWVPEMREAGADLVVALAHTGIGSAQHSDGMEHAALPLSRIDGIDALLTGHSHLLFPAPIARCPPGVDPQAGTLGGKPAVMAGFWGSHLGMIDLLLQRDSGRWRVLGSRSELRALAQHPAASPSVAAPPLRLEGACAVPAPRPRSPAVRSAVGGAHAQTLAAIRKPIGHAAQPLHSFFAMLGQSSATALVADAQRAYVTAHLAGSAHSGLPVVSAVAPFKAGGRSGARNFTNIPAGPLALRHVSDLYSYPNMIAALLLTGAEVRLWLERSASVFNRFQSGASTEDLLHPTAVSYQFEILYGLDYVFDLTQPARFDPQGAEIAAGHSRLREVTFAGQPLADDQPVIVCTNSFRANGAGGFAGTGVDRAIYRDTAVTRDVLRHHIAASGPVAPRRPAPLTFLPVEGARAILRTGPDALGHLDEIAVFAPVSLGVRQGGFLDLLLDLSQPGAGPGQDRGRPC